MDPATAPLSLEEEHHETKPVLKKVKEKVKNIKNAISKKSYGYGHDNDHHQHGDGDKMDEGLEVDDEIDKDSKIHCDPMHESSTPGLGTGPTEMHKNGSSLIMEELDENQAKNRTDPEMGTKIGSQWIEPNPEHESPAYGAKTGEKEISGGRGEGADGGVLDGLRLTTEKFVGDLEPPMTKAEGNTGIEHRPATSVRTTVNEISGGGAESAKGVGDGFGAIKEDSVEDLGVPMTESAKGVDNGFGLITKNFVKDPPPPRTKDETDEMEIERSQVYLSPTTGARTGMNEMSGVEGEGVEGVNHGLGLNTMELIEDPDAPKTEAEMKTRAKHSQGGEEIEILPELCLSLESMTVSTQIDPGERELSKVINNSSYTGMVSKVKTDARKEGEGEAVGKQGKGSSVKYVTENEKALSKDIPLQERTGSDEGGRGGGAVDKIRETVTSFLGGGQ